MHVYNGQARSSGERGRGGVCRPAGGRTGPATPPYQMCTRRERESVCTRAQRTRVGGLEREIHRERERERPKSIRPAGQRRKTCGRGCERASSTTAGTSARSVCRLFRAGERAATLLQSIEMPDGVSRPVDPFSLVLAAGCLFASERARRKLKVLKLACLLACLPACLPATRFSFVAFDGRPVVLRLVGQ
ncbi:hypothetical protein IWX50DRAFT_614845 [Phyllosticta citricarpa]|uniref:Uncharacterized protein n=1 Tax=Phyllosticta citricarpa TaxID=55181 RepID=A0ABR1LJT4_9PEZI